MCQKKYLTISLYGFRYILHFQNFPKWNTTEKNAHFTVLNIFNTLFLQQLLLSQNFNPAV